MLRLRAALAICTAIASGLALLATPACGGGDPAVPADAPAIDAIPVDAPPPGEPWFDEGLRRGRIELVEWVGGSAPLAQAHANFSPQPTRMRFVFYARVAVRHWQQETMRAGSCRLLENEPVFCTACAGLCVAPEVCEPYPDYASAGDLTFDGLRGPSLTLRPTPFYASQGQLPADAVADDATITVTATGAAVPAFTVATTAIPPLDPAVTPINNDELHLAAAGATDLTVTWTAAAPADPTARVRLTLNANNEGHGQPYAAVIECDAADVGALTIPAALIDAFPPASRQEACVGSDCPISTIARYRRNSALIDGVAVDFVVASQRAFWVVKP